MSKNITEQIKPYLKKLYASQTIEIYNALFSDPEGTKEQLKAAYKEKESNPLLEVWLCYLEWKFCYDKISMDYKKELKANRTKIAKLEKGKKDQKHNITKTEAKKFVQEKVDEKLRNLYECKKHFDKPTDEKENHPITPFDDRLWQHISNIFCACEGKDSSETPTHIDDIKYKVNVSDTRDKIKKFLKKEITENGMIFDHKDTDYFKFYIFAYFLREMEFYQEAYEFIKLSLITFEKVKKKETKGKATEKNNKNIEAYLKTEKARILYEAGHHCEAVGVLFYKGVFSGNSSEKAANKKAEDYNLTTDKGLQQTIFSLIAEIMLSYRDLKIDKNGYRWICDIFENEGKVKSRKKEIEYHSYHKYLLAKLKSKSTQGEQNFDEQIELYESAIWKAGWIEKDGKLKVSNKNEKNVEENRLTKHALYCVELAEVCKNKLSALKLKLTDSEKEKLKKSVTLYYKNAINIYKCLGFEIDYKNIEKLQKHFDNPNHILRQPEMPKLEKVVFHERQQQKKFMHEYHKLSLDDPKPDEKGNVNYEYPKPPAPKFRVLQRWNSHTPILSEETAPSKGGGYFLNLGHKGIVFDSGFDFINNMQASGYCFCDIDDIYISHAHNDHTNDLQSIASLLYVYNKDEITGDEYSENSMCIYKKIKEFLPNKRKAHVEKVAEIFSKNSPRRKKIQMYLAGSTLIQENYLKHFYKEDYQVDSVNPNSQPIEYPELFLEIQTIKAKHRDLFADNKAVGFGIRYKPSNADNILFVYTGDTTYDKEIKKAYEEILEESKKCQCKYRVLLAHIGGFKENEMYDKQYKNHLGRKGLHDLIKCFQPSLCIVSEFGEEFKTHNSRSKVVEWLTETLNNDNDLPDKPQILPADIGLSYKFNNKICALITNTVDNIEKISLKNERIMSYIECWDVGFIEFGEIESKVGYYNKTYMDDSEAQHVFRKLPMI
jgi:hypothetical protein